MQEESQPVRFSMQAKLITVGLIVGLTILLIYWVQHILAPFIAAIITAYLFNPLISILQRRTNIGRGIWIAILYILAFSLIYGVGTLVWPRITAQYQELASWIPSLITDINQELEGNRTIDLGTGLTIDLAPLGEQVGDLISELGRTFSGNVPHLVFSALETVIFTLVYLIVTFYLLLQANQLKHWAVGLIPAPYRAEISDLGRQIDRVLAAFIRGQLLLILIMSALLYIPLSILNVPYALVIAVTSGILEIIPIIGPWSATAIAITVALFQTDVPFGMSNVGLAALIGAIYFALRQIEDHFIIPNVMGPLVRLHPAVVIFAILAGGALAGAFGLFVSIPVAAIIRILLRYLYSKLTDETEPPASLPPAAKSEDVPAREYDSAPAPPLGSLPKKTANE
jgi:predicted PurR-regulated permease PerM